MGSRAEWDAFFGGVPATVTCEFCGRLHKLERRLREPQVLFMVCHDCERGLRVTVTHDDLAAARRVPAG